MLNVESAKSHQDSIRRLSFVVSTQPSSCNRVKQSMFVFNSRSRQELHTSKLIDYRIPGCAKRLHPSQLLELHQCFDDVSIRLVKSPTQAVHKSSYLEDLWVQSDLTLPRSHSGTVVPECIKGDSRSQWKSGKFDPRSPKNP